VILVEQVESKKEKRNHTEPEMEEKLSNGKSIKVIGPPTDDDAIQRALAEQLLQLHHEDKLMRPLLGSVKSILYIYRRARDGDDETKTASKSISTDQGTIHQDIYREFEAEIYPDVPTREITSGGRTFSVVPLKRSEPETLTNISALTFNGFTTLSKTPFRCR